MKQRLLILFVILAVSPRVHADLPITYVVQCDLKLADGKSISGFWEAGGYGGCTEQGGRYMVQGDDFKSVILDDAYLLNRFIKGNRGVPRFFSAIHPLHYPPAESAKVCCEEAEYILKYRAAFSAVLDSEMYAIDPALVKSAHMRGCRSLGIAPLITISAAELNLLQSPAKAIFVDEAGGSGVISLMSYNPAVDTPQKLQDLLKNFLDSKKALKAASAEENPWWLGIQDHVQEFKTLYLPKKIVLLNYGVTD